MSWPADGLPRFKVASISGGDSRGDDRPSPQGYVYDRAYCHRIVAATQGHTEGDAKRKAEGIARDLNGCGESPTPTRPALRPVPGHGLTGYVHRKCRCDVCRAAILAAQRRYRANKRAAT